MLSDKVQDGFDALSSPQKAPGDSSPPDSPFAATNQQKHSGKGDAQCEDSAPRPVTLPAEADPGRRHRMRGFSLAFGRVTLMESLKERGFVPPTILAKLELDTELDVEALRDLFASRLMGEKRFRSRMVLEGGGSREAMYEELRAEDIDMAHHVSEVAGAAGWDAGRVGEYMTALVATDFDYAHPAWLVRVLNNTASGPGGGARHVVLCYIHHALGDGVGLSRVLASLMDEGAPAGPAGGGGGKKLTLPALSWTASIVDPSLGRLRGAWAMAKGAAAALASPVVPGDAPNALKARDLKLSSRRRMFAESAHVPLRRVKEVAGLLRLLSGERYSVNDVLVATLSLTLQRYYADIGRVPPGGITVAVPLSLRGVEKGGGALWNNIGLLNLKLPFGRGHVGTARAAKEGMDAIKSSAQPVVERWLLRVATKACPDWLYEAISLLAFNKFTAMVSNVALPLQRMSMGGASVRGVSFFVNVQTGMYCGLQSYAGEVACTFSVDPNLEPDPQRIARYWHEEFEALSLQASQLQAMPVAPAPAGGGGGWWGWLLVSLLAFAMQSWCPWMGCLVMGKVVGLLPSGAKPRLDHVLSRVMWDPISAEAGGD